MWQILSWDTHGPHFPMMTERFETISGKGVDTGHRRFFGCRLRFGGGIPTQGGNGIADVGVQSRVAPITIGFVACAFALAQMRRTV